jgi:hypothetical protein
MKEGFESASTGLSSHGQDQWTAESGELEPDEYDTFVEKVRSIDLGIGVHLGADMKQVEAVLGAADTTGRTAGGYEYTYLFFADAEGPSSKQRHKGGFFAVVNSASLALTAVDRKVTSIVFFASPLSNDDAERWAFLTLNGKPLTQCDKNDFIAVLGNPINSSKYYTSWCHILASPVVESSEAPETNADDEAEPVDSTAAPVSAPEPNSGILVEVMFDTDTGLLYSLTLRQR